MDACNTIEEFFENLKGKNIIQDFELIKFRQKFHSITFNS